MQGTSGDVSECVIVWVVNMDWHQHVAGQSGKQRFMGMNQFVGGLSLVVYKLDKALSREGRKRQGKFLRQRLVLAQRKPWHNLCIIGAIKRLSFDPVKCHRRWVLRVIDPVTIGIKASLGGHQLGWDYSLADGLVAMPKSFLALRDSHEKQVVESATRFSEMLEDMTTLLNALRERLDDVESKISLVKKAVAGSAHDTDVSHKVKFPEPKSFGDGEKVLITSMDLSGDAKLWWRMRMGCKGVAAAPKTYRHSEGLELRRLGVKDLSSTIAAADGPLDYKLGNPSTSEFNENKSGGKNGKPKADDSQSWSVVASCTCTTLDCKGMRKSYLDWIAMFKTVMLRAYRVVGQSGKKRFMRMNQFVGGLVRTQGWHWHWINSGYVDNSQGQLSAV
ncbi:hypothetical protein Acr_23g0000920 [Actinidia rufa]|uniref:Uncharacterized protein n=1 Tax=Actinidia rufa TaxID=165716 RepID=A0A7J0GLK5_9ERIC|nr:hypothetical protein Acr_23g0000920 [Actinidia rufa]